MELHQTTDGCWATWWTTPSTQIVWFHGKVLYLIRQTSLCTPFAVWERTRTGSVVHFHKGPFIYISLCESGHLKIKLFPKRLKNFREQWSVPKCGWTIGGWGCRLGSFFSQVYIPHVSVFTYFLRMSFSPNLVFRQLVLNFKEALKKDILQRRQTVAEWLAKE